MTIDRLLDRTALVLAVLRTEHRSSGEVEQFKAVVELIDSSRLHINEVWLDEHLFKYLYYWLHPSGELIQGWDNAPHHPSLSIYPHHSHAQSGVMSSQVRSLSDVLDSLERRLIR